MHVEKRNIIKVPGIEAYEVNDNINSWQSVYYTDCHELMHSEWQKCLVCKRSYVTSEVKMWLNLVVYKNIPHMEYSRSHLYVKNYTGSVQ